MAVLNKYHHGGRVPAGAVDVMRGTPFGNPFPITPERTREQAVEEFRRFLWQQIKADPDFADQVRALHGRDLCCCCAPALCHAHVLERAAAWLAGEPSAATPSGATTLKKIEV